MSRVQAALKMCCPRCLQGPVFRTFWRMHPTCPVCGIHFEREAGYFTMAIFIGYVLDFMIVIPAGIAWYVQEWPTIPFFIGLSVVILTLSPFVFRLSRVIWLHIDEVIDPRDL